LIVKTAGHHDTATVLTAFQAGLEQIGRKGVSEPGEQGVVQLADEISVIRCEGLERTVSQGDRIFCTPRLIGMFRKDSDHDVERRLDRRRAITRGSGDGYPVDGRGLVDNLRD